MGGLATRSGGSYLAPPQRNLMVIFEVDPGFRTTG